MSRAGTAKVTAPETATHLLPPATLSSGPLRSPPAVLAWATAAVYENSKLRLALGWEGLRWALTANYVGNWIPAHVSVLAFPPGGDCSSLSLASLALRGAGLLGGLARAARGTGARLLD